MTSLVSRRIYRLSKLEKENTYTGVESTVCLKDKQLKNMRVFVKLPVLLLSRQTREGILTTQTFGGESAVEGDPISPLESH